MNLLVCPFSSAQILIIIMIILIMVWMMLSRSSSGCIWLVLRCVSGAVHCFPPQLLLPIYSQQEGFSLALFDMPNSNRFDILSISKISLSILISIYSRTALPLTYQYFYDPFSKSFDPTFTFWGPKDFYVFCLLQNFVCHI